MTVSPSSNQADHEPVPISASLRREREALVSLPVSLTPFIGREREVAAVCELVRRDVVRLVTLTGPGGVGKTRLALAAAETLAAEFADGCCYVPLASLTDPALALSAIAQALGVREAGDRALADGLQAYLRHKTLLLVLDNFERIVAAGPILLDLLATCPRLKALATSREALRLSGERPLLVPPLSLPESPPDTTLSPERLAEFEAIRLFVECAQAARSDFALTEANAVAVAAICRRLDGLPLAIELAAARMSHLSPMALLTRLERRLTLLTGGARDLPDRHQTMRDAIAWSYDLLTAEEQLLFCRLAVFVGGFTLEAAEAVATSDVLDGISSLLDKSLLRHDPGLPWLAGDDEPRYAMLETIREYGLEQLDAAGEGEATRKRHAVWAMAFAEQAWTKLYREPLGLAALDRVEIEHGNLRAALAWLAETGDAERSLWLASGLAPFWLFRSFRIEGRGWLERGLSQAGEEQIPTELRARVVHCMGLLTEGQARTVQYHEESLRLWRELGDRWGVAAALFLLGFAANNEGDYDRAWTLCDEGLAIFRAMGIKERAADCLCELGRAACGRGEAQLAMTHLEAALALFREVEDSYGIGYALIRLGVVAVDMGDHARAAATFREGLAAWDAVGMKEGLIIGLAGVATLAAAGGHAKTAGRLVGVVDGLREVLGYELSLPERTRYERAEAALRTTLGDTAFAAARAAGRVLPLGAAIAEATAFLSAPAVPVVPIVSQPAFGLTPRELDVLRLLVEGHSDRAIGEALFIGHRTVMTHVANILSKLGVDSRTAAAAQAIRHNLV